MRCADQHSNQHSFAFWRAQEQKGQDHVHGNKQHPQEPRLFPDHYGLGEPEHRFQHFDGFFNFENFEVVLRLASLPPAKVLRQPAEAHLIWLVFYAANVQNVFSMLRHKRKQYWLKNLKYLSILLSIWFVTSFGCAILFVDDLDQFRLGGFKLGFWFAQQGSIYVFVILIFVYVFLMNRLDRKFGVEEKEEKHS